MIETTVQKTYTDFILPPTIVSKIDIARMMSEAEQVDSDMTASDVRAKTGVTTPIAPILSELFEQFLAQNELKFVTSLERTELIEQLRLLKDNVPIIHMTFAVEADRESLSQLVAWLRESIHSQAVIAVGLQPALVAGVYLRTPNHVHDLSMRAALNSSHDLLVKELETLRGRS
ncbi:MAG: hypothetical protein WAW80_00430 [Candidatus Saccharimonadales bacterium]